MQQNVKIKLKDTLKNLLKKKIRIEKYSNDTYKIEERYTILFVIHWWNQPIFSPSFICSSYQDTYDYVKKQYPNALIENPN